VDKKMDLSGNAMKWENHYLREFPEVSDSERILGEIADYPMVHENRWLQYAMYALLGVGACVTGLFLYWLFWPMDVFAFQKITVLGAHNGEITFQLDYCKNERFDNLEAETHYALVDHVTRGVLGMEMINLPSGCGSTQDSVFVSHVPKGTYRLEITKIYEPNPIRRIPVVGRSAPFELK
jgi:hypothetical protein